MSLIWPDVSSRVLMRGDEARVFTQYLHTNNFASKHVQAPPKQPSIGRLSIFKRVSEHAWTKLDVLHFLRGSALVPQHVQHVRVQAGLEEGDVQRVVLVGVHPKVLDLAHRDGLVLAGLRVGRLVALHAQTLSLGPRSRIPVVS